MSSILEHERQIALVTYNTWVSDLHGLMFNTLESIIELDQLLNQFQPIHPGRLRVMWFAINLTEKQYPNEREPRMVQWNYSFSTSRWQAKRVPLSRLLRAQSSKDVFAHHADGARTILENLRSHIELYHRARRLLTRLEGRSLARKPKQLKLLALSQSRVVKFVDDFDRQALGSAP